MLNGRRLLADGKARKEADALTCGPLQMFMYSASGTLVRTHSLNRFFARSWSSTAFSSAALKCSLPQQGNFERSEVLRCIGEVDSQWASMSIGSHRF